MGDGRKRGFDFLRPLLQDMCQDDPTKRQTMAKVVSRLEGIIESGDTAIGSSALVLYRRMNVCILVLSVFQDIGQGSWVACANASLLSQGFK